MPLIAERLSIVNGRGYFDARANIAKGGSLSKKIVVNRKEIPDLK